MHIESLKLTNFRCFGPETVVIPMAETFTAFVGDNGAGKTAIMYALLRLFGISQELSRCTQFPESRLFVFNPSPGFNCIVTALKSRTLALKTRTKFLLKFVRDISAKMTLSSFLASVSVRDLSTNSSADSGI